MNKKLIKQLESVGFVTQELKSTLVVETVAKFAYYYNLDLFAVHGSTTHRYETPNFKQILAAIKEHTGLELQPKKTETQRIEALEELVKLQNEAIAKLEERTKENAKEVKELKANESIATIEKVLESLKELHSLAIALNAQKKDINFEVGGVVSDSKVHTDETVLSAFVEDRNNKIKEALSKIATPEQGQPVFKVGDEVVIVCKPNENWATELLDAIEASSVHRVSSINHDECTTDPVGVDINGRVYVFAPKELQHAPKKELKFGGWAEVVGHGGHEFEIGQKVLVGASQSRKYICSSLDDWGYVDKEDLKAL